MTEYADDSFDRSKITFDLTDKTWITLPSDHQAFPILLSYIVSNLVNQKGGYLIDIMKAEESNADSTQNPLKNIIYDRVKPKIGYGQYSFRNFEGEILHALYQHIGEPVGTDCGVRVLENLIIFTSSTIESLCRFISTMIKLAETPEKGKFLCFNWHIRYQYWREEARIDARPIDSVVLPSKTKDRLIQDIERFLLPKTKQFYVRNGIPYRRSYLFYGVPGTGKTSMVQALAGHFHRNVCFLLPTHPEMTDDSLREAIQRIPSNSIVVFEDIDALFDIHRSNKISKSSLTFSGLLNALDGIGSPNGQIFVLTTNLRDNLDHALIRNGRVDLHVEFTYATEEQMEIMWTNFYPQGSQLANDFSSRVMTSLKEKGLAVTTSALQHFFITQMDATPEEALEQSHTIVDEIVQNSSQSMLESARNAASASESASKENENLKGEDKQVAEETKEQEQAKKLSKSARRRLNRKVHRSVLNT
mmetsp:Transcript_17479/g.18970  ORF Transcript_17479/g.18970 Transcript_17479/m.18970 type:complete len:475 (-) Transcript_17479:35-1459(-)